MAKPFDAATKQLVEADPLAWLAYTGLPGKRAELVDADLTTVTSEADRIIFVHDPDYLAHVEMQATYKDDMDIRVLRYNALTYCKYLLPVQSVVILLRKEADGPAMSGRAGYQTPPGAGGSLSLTYRVIRVWEHALEEALAGPLATLPLAPLTNVATEALPNVLKLMQARIDRDATQEERGMLWTTTFLLLGLKLTPDEAIQLLKGVHAMTESSTYQYILAQGAETGELREARRILLLLGERRLGPPDATTQQAIGIGLPLDRLETMIERLNDYENWEELLASVRHD